MRRSVLTYVSAFILSIAAFLFCGCDLPKPNLDGWSSEELIDELLDRGVPDLGDLFGDDDD